MPVISDLTARNSIWFARMIAQETVTVMILPAFVLVTPVITGWTVLNSTLCALTNALITEFVIL